MSKYTLTVEQFKEIIMPFIEEALAVNAAKVKAHNFKVGAISEVKGEERQPKLDMRIRDFKIEFTWKRLQNYFAYSINDGTSLLLVEFPDSPITDYLLDHREEINHAFRTYMYKLYGEDYKEYLINFYKRINNEILEQLHKEIHQKEKEIAALKKEQKTAEQSYAEEIKDIENILNPHHV